MMKRDAPETSCTHRLIADPITTPASGLLDNFITNLELAGGEYLQSFRLDPLEPIRARLGTAQSVHSQEYGIARAAFAIAETGSVCITNAILGVDPASGLPGHLIVLLDPADILLDLHQAYLRNEWRRTNYAVLQSGPSKTTDLDGVLIHGNRSGRLLSVLALARVQQPLPVNA